MTADASVPELLDATARIDPEFILMGEADFRRFYERTAAKLRSYIALACGSADLADDLLQECFYRLIRADLPELNEFQVRSYLYKTAASLVSDHHRKIRRESKWRNKAVPETARSPSPGLNQDLMRLFRTLKPRQQSLLWLAYVEGFNHREIAAALGIGERSVRVVLSRARKKLAGALEDEGIGPKEGRRR